MSMFQLKRFNPGNSEECCINLWDTMGFEEDGTGPHLKDLEYILGGYIKDGYKVKIWQEKL